MTSNPPKYLLLCIACKGVDSTGSFVANIRIVWILTAFHILLVFNHVRVHFDSRVCLEITLSTGVCQVLVDILVMLC